MCELELAQNRAHLLALVSTVMNIWFHETWGISGPGAHTAFHGLSMQIFNKISFITQHCCVKMKM
jgi:hypothetical protein